MPSEKIYRESFLPKNILRFGSFELDIHESELRKSGVKQKLPGQAIHVLILLVEQAGKTVKRDELCSKLWPADTFVDFDHCLNNAIQKLRLVLNDSPTSPRFIETVPRRGYRFLAHVEVVTPRLPINELSTTADGLLFDLLQKIRLEMMDALSSQIERTVKSMLESRETKTKLEEYIEHSGQARLASPAKLLREVAGEAVEEIRKAGFVSVDARTLTASVGLVFQIPYDKRLTVDEFLDRVFFAINRSSPIAGALLKPFTYGIEWVLSDRDSATVFDNIGTIWALTQRTEKFDDRTLVQIGIAPGMFLRVIRVGAH